MARRKRKKKSVSQQNFRGIQVTTNTSKKVNRKLKRISKYTQKNKSFSTSKQDKNVSRETNINRDNQSEPPHKSHYRKEIRSPKQIEYTWSQKQKASHKREEKQNLSQAYNGFENVNGLTPFDNEFNNDNEKILNAQKQRFNSQEIAEKKRRQTFEEKHGIFGQQYDDLLSILGSSNFRELKELGYLSSEQIMDLTFDYNGKADSAHIEQALLDVISNINSEYMHNVNQLRNAMDMGFTLEESEYLTSMDVKNQYVPIKGIARLRDILVQRLVDEGIVSKLDEELWNEYLNIGD